MIPRKLDDAKIEESDQTTETPSLPTKSPDTKPIVDSDKPVDDRKETPEINPTTKHSKAKEALLRAVNLTKERVRIDNPHTPKLSLTTAYYNFEKLDPLHRRGKDIEDFRQQWLKSKTTLPFIDWLETKDAKELSKVKKLNYRTEVQEQKKVQVQFKDGKLYLHGALLDTTQFKGKGSQYAGFGAFVMDNDGGLYLVEHKKNETHASMLGGSRIPAAGMIRVENGVITGIINVSGHYKPGIYNLYYAVKNIPRQYFSEKARVIYSNQRFSNLSKQWKTSDFASVRAIGAKLGRRYSYLDKSIDEFSDFARKEIERMSKKFIYKRDNRDNRYENVLFESYLAKTIIENSKTWKPLIIKINTWIYSIIEDQYAKKNQAFLKLVMEYIQKHSSHIDINKENFLEKAALFLFSDDLSLGILFHKKFFEKMYPITQQQSEKDFYHSLPSYSKIRTKNLFEGKNRGSAVSGTKRELLQHSDKFFESRNLGIISGKIPKGLTGYFKPFPGKFAPSIGIYPGRTDRTSYYEAQKNREKQHSTSETYAAEIKERDISMATGGSGTATKVLSPLLDVVGINYTEAHEYLMVLASVLCSRGHHSIYEVMLAERNLMKPNIFLMDSHAQLQALKPLPNSYYFLFDEKHSEGERWTLHYADDNRKITAYKIDQIPNLSEALGKKEKPHNWEEIGSAIASYHEIEKALQSGCKLQIASQIPLKLTNTPQDSYLLTQDKANEEGELIWRLTYIGPYKEKYTIDISLVPRLSEILNKMPHEQKISEISTVDQDKIKEVITAYRVYQQKLGFIDIQYNHSFYHAHFITPEFRESDAYKRFLKVWPKIVDHQIKEMNADFKDNFKIERKKTNSIIVALKKEFEKLDPIIDPFQKAELTERFIRLGLDYLNLLHDEYQQQMLLFLESKQKDNASLTHDRVAAIAKCIQNINAKLKLANSSGHKQEIFVDELKKLITSKSICTSKSGNQNTTIGKRLTEVLGMIKSACEKINHKQEISLTRFR